MNFELDPEVIRALSKSLGHVSRQRVRFVQMELRKYSTDARIRNERHFWTLLENSGLRFSSRTATNFLPLIKDQRGINVEVAIKYLKESQKRTRRDSVEALRNGETAAAEKRKRAKSAKGERNKPKDREAVTRYSDDQAFRRMSKRFSLDEFRRVGWMVANASALTGRGRDLNAKRLTEEDKEREAQGEQLLETLLDNQPTSSKDEKTINFLNSPADHLPKMTYLTVPKLEKKSLAKDDPFKALDDETTVGSDLRVSKSKTQNEPCVITITVEDTDFQPEDHRYVQEEKNEHSEPDKEEKPEKESDKLLDSAETAKAYKESPYLLPVEDNHDTKVLSLQNPTSVYEDSASSDENSGKLTIENNEGVVPEEECQITVREAEDQSSECINAKETVSIQEKLIILETVEKAVEPDKEPGSKPIQTEFYKGSEEVILPSEDDSNAIEASLIDKTIVASSDLEETCDGFRAGHDVEKTDSDSSIPPALEKAIEDISSSDADDKESEKTFHDEGDDIPEYSTDSFVTDDVSELADSELQSTSCDEDVENEIDCDVRSIADYGGEEVNVGGTDVTMYPPGWTNDKEYTDLLENKATSSNPKLDVDWVYGCDISHAQSMASLGNDELIYGAGCIVVLYNYARNTQRHYFGHSASISCIAVHPEENIVGSAQTESPAATKMMAEPHSDLTHEPYHGRIHVRIWNAVDLSTMYTMGVGTFQRIIRKMQFMNYKSFILTIEDDEQSSLTLWDGGCKLKKIGSSFDPAVALEEIGAQQSNRRANNSAYNATRAVAASTANKPEFAMAGREHLGFWKIKDLDDYSTESSEREDFVKIVGPLRGDFVKHFRPRHVTCCVSVDRSGSSYFVSGDTNGTILVWSEIQKEVIAGAKHAHECPISCILVTKAHIFAGGTTDKSVTAFAWGKEDLESAGTITLPHNVGQISALAIIGSHLFVGTNSNLIVAVTLDHPAYAFHRIKDTKFGRNSAKSRSSQPTPFHEQRDVANSIFGRFEKFEVSRGSTDGIKCVCVADSLKKRCKMRQPTPVPTVDTKRSTKSARARRTPATYLDARLIRSARPYNAQNKGKASSDSRNPTPDGTPKLTIAFSSPKLRTSERILKRERARNLDEGTQIPNFGLDNYIDKRIFAVPAFPKGSESKASVESDATEQSGKSTFFFASSDDGCVTAYDAVEHCVIGRMNLPTARKVTCMDCSSRLSFLILGCLSGHVILIRVNVDGFEVISESYFRGKRAPRRPINTIRFSKSGKRLAFAISNEIIICNVKGTGLQEIERCVGHTTDNIVSLDWSSARLRGSELIRSFALLPDPEVFVWSTDPAELIQDLSTVRNIKWQTETNFLDYGTKGIWDHFISRDILSCLAVSGVKYRTKSDEYLETNDDHWGASESQTGHDVPGLSATCCVGDTLGCVSSSHYPCITEDAKYTVKRPFHSAVSCITTLDGHLFATGMEDRNIVQFDVGQELNNSRA